MALSCSAPRRLLNRAYVKERLKTVTDSYLPSALREVRTDLTKRPAIVGMLALGLILGISGPFGTIDVMSPIARILYWTTVVVATYATGSLISAAVHALLRHRSIWISIPMSSIVLGLALTALLTALNFAAFDMWYTSSTDFLGTLAEVTLIAAVVEICTYLLRSTASDAPPKTAPLQLRLPLEKRGALIGLSAEDHYVRVTTIKGQELVLMRLSDAIAETGDTAGLQIHRSHWVATSHITSVARKGDRGEITLSDTTTRPVSRGYMPAVRNAGLLPTGRGS